MNDLIKAIILSYYKRVNGIINITGDETISRYKFATLVAKAFKINNKYLNNKTYKLNKNSDKNIFIISLSNKKIKKKININFKKLSSAIREIKNNLR